MRGKKAAEVKTDSVPKNINPVPSTLRRTGTQSSVIDRKREEKNVTKRFEKDEDALHGIPLREKIEKKKTLVEDYRDYCQTKVKNENGIQDDIFCHWVVWLFDIGNMEEFLKYINIAIKLNQKPQFLKRSFAEFKYWSILDWATEEWKAGRSPEPYFSQCFNELEKKGWDNVHQQLGERYLYLQFHLLSENGQEHDAIKLGKVALTRGVKIKTKLEELIKDFGYVPDEKTNPETEESEEGTEEEGNENTTPQPSREESENSEE